jgi:Fe-S-cluster-containing dehydrogenase component
MKKWNMIVDVSRCHNCYNCFVATKDEYVGNEFPGYTAPQPLHGHAWVDMESRECGQWPMVETSFRPVMCNHCDDAPCMKAATGGAIRKRGDGIVIIDPEKAKGQQQIVSACPYGAIYWNEERQIPQAWPFDAHLLDAGWKKTKLETVCPTDVFRSVKVTDEEMAKIAKAEQLTTLEPKSGARPRVYYKNNHRFSTIFVGGTVVTWINGDEECVEGAGVTVWRGDELVGRASSDAFGEFKVSKIEPGAGPATLKIDVAGKPEKIVSIELCASAYIGCVEV